MQIRQRFGKLSFNKQTDTTEIMPIYHAASRVVNNYYATQIQLIPLGRRQTLATAVLLQATN